MDRETFEHLVGESLIDIPEKFRALLENIAIVVQDEPTPEQLRKTGLHAGSLLLGLYEGVPKTGRYGQTPILPDKITIFQRSIEVVARTPEAISEEVRKTVWHEIGHHFGLSEHAVRKAQARRYPRKH
ncbi:MAG: metallopeptidase family protein [Candidatus Kerfeldbacteria bacterium]